MLDVHSDKPTSLDLFDADKFDGICPILSMGKTIRLGFGFYFEDAGNMYAIAPNGVSKFRIDLSDEDIIRILHDVRGGTASTPVPSLPAATTNAVVHVRRTAEALNAEMLHEIFCHRSMEKIYRTLEHTTGFKAIRLPDKFCGTCAQMKAKRRGLSHKVQLSASGSAHCNTPVAAACNTPVAAACNLPVAAADRIATNFDVMAAAPSEDDYDDPNDDAEYDHLAVEVEYVAPVAGRSLGFQAVPQISRFDLETLRPFEIMFADNKDYEQQVRGGRQIAFVLYDLKSTAKFKIDLFSRIENGKAFRSIMAANGVHKLPYSCRIYTDGCGSMKHVEMANNLMGIDHAFIPPHMQSLNEAEKICYVIWDDAAAVMHTSKAPSRLFAEAVSFSLYIDMRTAITASRGFLTPYELIKGTQPSILKLHRFYTLRSVRSARHSSEAQGTRQGRLHW